jgi:hypothetical protein
MEFEGTSEEVELREGKILTRNFFLESEGDSAGKCGDQR